VLGRPDKGKWRQRGAEVGNRTVGDDAAAKHLAKELDQGSRDRAPSAAVEPHEALSNNQAWAFIVPGEAYGGHGTQARRPGRSLNQIDVTLSARIRSVQAVMSAPVIGESWASSAIRHAPLWSDARTPARQVPLEPRTSNSARAPASRAAFTFANSSFSR
jgi:hypothetical protein